MSKEAMLAYTLPLSVCLLTGLLGFIVGALLQQDNSYRTIQTAIATDPYVYQCRHKIYDALRLLGQQQDEVGNNERVDDTSRSLGEQFTQSQDADESNSVISHYIRWLNLRLHTVTMFFTYSLGDERLPEPEPAHFAIVMKYGFPGLADIHVYRNYVLSYDRRNRIAHWVCEHLEGDCLSSPELISVQKPSEYMVDSTIPLLFRASPRDYRNTDWVGGHMASPQNYRCDPLKYIETYLLPNIMPVSRGLKSSVWTRLEAYVRELAIECGSVYVYTGPLFMPQRITYRNWAIRHQVIGMNTVAVPTHFFKVIIAESKRADALPYMEGYVVPNADIDKNLELSSFISEVRDIEHFAGLKFYCGAQRSSVNTDPTAD